MLRTVRPLLFSALALGCDTIPIQFKLGTEIQREFKVTHALAFVGDTTHMVVMVNDDAHWALEPKARVDFEQRVATFAVRHYTRGRLTSVAVVITAATERAEADAGTRAPEATLFVPEYYPDGTVRLGHVARPPTPKH